MNAKANPDIVKLEGFAEKDLYAKREKIFTRYVGGFFQKLRFYTGWPLLLGYFLTPWLNWGERQAILFDLPARQFHFFGLTIWPQDLWLLGWLLMVSAFGLFTVTTIVGRLWCGYTCPQTVWTSIFMWVEQLTEGSRTQRMRLDSAPWSLTKLRKRTLKHALWLGWAFLTGLTFVGYFSPIRELSIGLLTLDVESLSYWALLWILFFTAATYINAGWLREQVCLYMCPYARFQSAMIDKDTLIVSYDERRGEPRGSRKRFKEAQTSSEASLGDCIDCQMCVQVCPTGIDIRDGLQYQCIGCAHCIDACNQVMEKMNYAKDLIGYTTMTNLAGGKTKLFRPRSVGYATMVAIISAALLVALFLRAPVAVDVLRDRGELYRQAESGVTLNDYQLIIMNKTQSPNSYTISVQPDTSFEIASDTAVELEAGAVLNIPLIVKNTAAIQGISDITIQVCQTQPEHCAEEASRFISAGIEK